VSPLDFGDIPAKAFIEAFNIKETFLGKNDESEFSKMMRELIFSQYLDI